MIFLDNMARSKKEQERYLERRREMKKLSMRKSREKMRNNPIKHEEVKAKDRARYKKQKEEGKIKLIGEMKSRDQRRVRKEWKKRSEKYRIKKKTEANINEFVERNTPPSSPEPHVEMPQPRRSRQQDSGKKLARKNREKKNKQIKELQEKLEKANSRVNKYKKRLSRLQQSHKKDTPRKKVAKIIRGLKAKVTPELRKKLLFAEVISNQISENFKSQKSTKGKRQMTESVNGEIIKKYQFVEYVASLTSSGCLRQRRYYRRKQLKDQMMRAKKDVEHFLAKDECSRLTAGKKETITVKKMKKQRRLLNESLKDLHKKFIFEYPIYKNMSYSVFCKFRPFWVMNPSVSNRNTCLCKTHENVKLLMTRIVQQKILNERSESELVKSLCCEKAHVDEACLERKCSSCKHKTITTNKFNSEELTYYDEWKNIKVDLIIKGQLKTCKKVTKERITCTQGDLLEKLKKLIFPFMQHCANVKHQFKAVSDIKKKIQNNEILLHFDFSENFNCKYSEEIQSAHFGGSKPQITLHTSVCYYNTNTDDDSTNPQSKSFCSLSQSLRHDPVAVAAHLDCLIDTIKTSLVPNLEKIHFVSDGPSTQYRNKTMFFLLANHIAKKHALQECSWNYCEAGHGKGAPDGVGGCLKRSADGLVAKGKDIPNFETLVNALKENTRVQIMTVSEDDIRNIDGILPEPEKLVTFKGTMKIHQITWSKGSSNLQARRLSCFSCKPAANCDHFGIGSINTSPLNCILLSNNNIQSCILICRLLSKPTKG